MRRFGACVFSIDPTLEIRVVTRSHVDVGAVPCHACTLPFELGIRCNDFLRRTPNQHTRSSTRHTPQPQLVGHFSYTHIARCAMAVAQMHNAWRQCVRGSIIAKLTRSRSRSGRFSSEQQRASVPVQNESVEAARPVNSSHKCRAVLAAIGSRSFTLFPWSAAMTKTKKASERQHKKLALPASMSKQRAHLQSGQHTAHAQTVSRHSGRWPPHRAALSVRSASCCCGGTHDSRVFML